MVSLSVRATKIVATALAVAALCFAAGCTVRPDLEAEAEKLRALHEQVLEAHRSGDVSGWMDAEADPYISVNGGAITFPSAAERRAAREPYLNATTFTAYRDLQPPVVRVSVDGTLGWVIAEVEFRGTQVSDDGADTPVDAIWAWIELYERQEGVWRLVGNVSNRRP